MKINIKVRAKNPIFWFNIALAIFMPMLAYFGLTGEDMTTWAKLFETLVNAVKNPYVVFTVIVSVWNALVDPTTRGIGDSERALTYQTPNK